MYFMDAVDDSQKGFDERESLGSANNQDEEEDTSMDDREDTDDDDNEEEERIPEERVQSITKTTRERESKTWTEWKRERD